MFNKILGAALVFISIVIIVNLIPGLLALIGQLTQAISQNKAGIWGTFTASLLIQAVGWVIAYFMFRTGRRLFKSNQ